MVLKFCLPAIDHAEGTASRLAVSGSQGTRRRSLRRRAARRYIAIPGSPRWRLSRPPRFLHIRGTRGSARPAGGLPLQVYHQVSRELWSAPGCRHGTAHDRTRDDGRASGTGPTKHMGMDICQEKSRDSPSEGRRSVYRAITWSDRTNGPYRQSRRQGERIIVEELPHTARRPAINPLLRYRERSEEETDALVSGHGDQLQRGSTGAPRACGATRTPSRTCPWATGRRVTIASFKQSFRLSAILSAIGSGPAPTSRAQTSINRL